MDERSPNSEPDGSRRARHSATAGSRALVFDRPTGARDDDGVRRVLGTARRSAVRRGHDPHDPGRKRGDDRRHERLRDQHAVPIVALEPADWADEVG